MAKKAKQKATTTFQLGEKVRVRQGVNDADYPDMPLGGWAGSIAKVHDDGMVTVCWNTETLDAIHPVFTKRCEKDGLELEKYWLNVDNLELDTGGPLEIVQPKLIVTKPLSPKDQDDRIRMVFNLTSNDPLPEVDNDMQQLYHEYLSKNLAFSFTATLGDEYGHPEPVKLIGMGDPHEPMIDEMEGIFCDARMEGQAVTVPLGELEDAKSKLNRQILDDYRHWFHNFG